jgi:hypothetical protein
MKLFVLYSPTFTSQTSRLLSVFDIVPKDVVRYSLLYCGKVFMARGCKSFAQQMEDYLLSAVHYFFQRIRS